MKLTEIAGILNGRIEGKPDAEIEGVGKIETANKNQITFISNPLYEKYFKTTGAGAIILSENFKTNSNRKDISIIRVDDPYLSFLKILEVFQSNSNDETGIAENCFVAPGCELGENIYIGNFVSIERNSKIGSNTKIYSNCSIDSDVTIGENCIIYPNVTIYKDCEINNNVIIHSGSVIGSDGFGFARQADGSYKKIPQNGKVVIEENVEIGSNTCIDRATMGETRICRGVKLDSQIQIAHNVFIDENTVIAAQVGIAGSARIGKRCMIGGQSGIVGHITICDDVIIGASVGVSKSINKPGIYSGYRARPYKDDLKNEIAIRNINKIEEKINQLEQKLSGKK